MKKGATPELDGKWWSKNKAKTMKKSGLGKALTTFEVARERTNAKGMKPPEIVSAGEAAVKALTEVKKKVAFAVSCCNAKLHKETIEALKKYPKIIMVEEKRLAGMIARNKNAAPVVPPQKKGKNLTYWEMDVATQVKKQVNPDWISDFKGYRLHLTINSDISKVLTDEKDPQTLAFMVEDAQKVGAAVVSRIVDTIKKIEASTKDKPVSAVDKVRSGFKPLVDKAIQAAAKELDKIPGRRWANFVKRKQQYKDYQINVAKTFTLGSLGILGGVIGLATTPFTAGASTVLGLVSLTRSVAAITREIVNAARDAETTLKVLQSDLKSLEKAYHKADGTARKRQGASEVASSVVKGLLGTDPVWATLPKCADNAKTLDNKLAGLEVAGRKASTEIMKGFDICDDLEKTFKSASGKAAAKVLDKIKKARKALDGSLKKCTSFGGRISAISDKIPDLQKVLKALQGTNPKFAQIFDKVWPAVVNLGLSGASGGLGIADAKSALDIANASISMANDVAGEIDAQLS
ncbi:MAG: hypothetical protein AAF393_05640 [Pseudomonadota bacterium]